MNCHARWTKVRQKRAGSNSRDRRLHFSGRGHSGARRKKGMKRSSLLPLLFLWAAPLIAQPIQVAPASPTTNDVVQVINVPQCQTPLVTQSGYSFQIDAGVC